MACFACVGPGFTGECFHERIEREGRLAREERARSKPDHVVEQVDHPSHYQTAAGLEAIDVVEAFGLGFCLGNAIKYVLRAGKKRDALTDLRKARWYLDRAIKQAEAKT